MAKMYNKGGMMKVKHVIVLPPTRSKMLPKLGTDWPTKRSKASVPVLKAQRFQQNSKEQNNLHKMQHRGATN